MGPSVVLGVDAGGSYTRVACVGLDGIVLGVGRAGGGSPTHNADASEQVRLAVLDALDRAGRRPPDVTALVAGLAAFNREGDRSWAEQYFEIDGLRCPLTIVNDTVVAQAGAFAGGPGIIVVAGTGSMIFAVTETGELVRNDRYHHYAGGARHLSFAAIWQILASDAVANDAGFVARILEYWDAADRGELRHRVSELAMRDSKDVKRFYGGMAPLVTAAAEESALASAACDWLAGVTSMGVRLLAAHFDEGRVLVSCAGAVATCPAMSRRLGTLLEEPAGRFELVDARLEPVGGAVLLALRAGGVPADDAVITSVAYGMNGACVAGPLTAEKPA
jgi:glucosamine kinase